jgi:hypothetical protein
MLRAREETMKQGKWLGVLMIAAALSAQVRAGEHTLDIRGGITEMRIDGDDLTSGDSFSDGLMNVGIHYTYAWPKGPFVEFSLSQSVDPLPLFNWSDVDHVSLAGGWQFSKHNWVFKPKLGLTRSSLESDSSDFFDDDEPALEIREVVPYIDLGLEYRLWGKLGLGIYFRHNFEDAVGATSYGTSFGWTF